MPFYLLEKYIFKCEECETEVVGEYAVPLGGSWANPSVPKGWMVLQFHPTGYRCYCPRHRPDMQSVETIEVNPEDIRVSVQAWENLQARKAYEQPSGDLSRL